MPCSDGELGKLPYVELLALNGRECRHECRGGCGDRLHGICGEVEDPDCDNGRICPGCISKRKRSNPAKRKAGHGFLQSDVSKKKKAGASEPRKRLTFEEKLEILKLLDQKVARAEVARRFGCEETAVGAVKRERATLEVDSSDDEEEVEDTGDAETAGSRKIIAPPPYSDLSPQFGFLEQMAESADNSEARYFLRKAEMLFLSAHAAKPTRQADIRTFTES